VTLDSSANHVLADFECLHWGLATVPSGSTAPIRFLRGRSFRNDQVRGGSGDGSGRTAAAKGVVHVAVTILAISGQHERQLSLSGHATNANAIARAGKPVFRIRVTNPGSPAISVQAVWNK
jgi:hypothetical protein